MKLIIEVTKDYYEWLKEKADNKKASVSDITILDGLPYKEKPHGKWIEHDSKELSDKGFYLCSRCKAGFQRYERGVRHSDLPWIDGQKYELHRIDSFCPNCGADMRGGKV